MLLLKTKRFIVGVEKPNTIIYKTHIHSQTIVKYSEINLRYFFLNERPVPWMPVGLK